MAEILRGVRVLEVAEHTFVPAASTLLADWGAEVAADPQSEANGYIQECETAAGVKFRLAATPVHFDEEAPPPKRAPLFNEHGDEIPGQIGYDMGGIIDRKVKGVVA